MPSIVLTSELIAAMSIIISPLLLTRIFLRIKTTAVLRPLVKVSEAGGCMYVCIHACRGVTLLPALSFCLRDSGFTGEIPLHLRRPIEWDSPELCPYTVSCSSERLIVLLLRQAAFPLPFSVYIIHRILLFGSLRETDLNSSSRDLPCNAAYIHRLSPDPIHTCYYEHPF